MQISDGLGLLYKIEVGHELMALHFVQNTDLKSAIATTKLTYLSYSKDITHFEIKSLKTGITMCEVRF